MEPLNTAGLRILRFLLLQAASSIGYTGVQVANTLSKPGIIVTLTPGFCQFYCYARRTAMTANDTGQPFRGLKCSIQLSQVQSFDPIPPNSATGTTCFAEGEEDFFDQVLRENITSPKIVSWAAHWLAVDGVHRRFQKSRPSS